ncbi:MAG TPA: dCTP deaminase [Solirubrobacterales bacterium]|jgi:dCTP deaminase|nr:dCTP deaminase [Solirubrobacterales bacterium]
MSALGREDLERALGESNLSRRLFVTPLLERSQIGRGAIDLRLGTEFLLLQRVQRAGLDPSKISQEELAAMQERVVVPFGGDLWLHPRHFVLAGTLEYLGLPDDLSAAVVSRSSWGRVGLLVATAVFIHPGFKGCLTLELVNEGDAPIRLSPGSKIAQLELHRLQTPAPARTSDSAKYLAPVRPEASRLPAEQKEFARLEEVGKRLRSRLG